MPADVNFRVLYRNARTGNTDQDPPPGGALRAHILRIDSGRSRKPNEASLDIHVARDEWPHPKIDRLDEAAGGQNLVATRGAHAPAVT